MSHRSLDARSELVFDVQELRRRAGTMKNIVRVVAAPGGLDNNVISVMEASPVRLELNLESVGEGILVSGVAMVSLQGECSRCLGPVFQKADIEIQELFVYPGIADDDEEASRVEDDKIDLEPVLRDAVMLTLPFTPVCRADCAGLCSRCGADLNQDPDHTHVEQFDPRWAGLTDWTDKI